MTEVEKDSLHRIFKDYGMPIPSTEGMTEDEAYLVALGALRANLDNLLKATSMVHHANLQLQKQLEEQTAQLQAAQVMMTFKGKL